MQSDHDQQPEHISRPYVDQAALNYTPSQVATSHIGSMSALRTTFDDDDQSRVSAYTSYTAPGDDEGLIRRERGRVFNVLNETYSLPTDTDEWNRLDKQHMAITLGLGGLYPAPEVVNAILAPQSGVTKKILDLGCGTGIWSTEMATEFPHCEVVGVDLAPVPLPPESLPPNCRFEMDDINLGLFHLRDQFDVVLARAIGLGVKDFQKTLADVQACLKPGGILIWIDADYDLYSGWPAAYRPFWTNSNLNGSYMQRVLYEIKTTSMNLLRSDLRTMERILEAGFWRHATLLDPDTCKLASLYLPIGTWCDGGEDVIQAQRTKYVGILMRQNLIEAGNTGKPLLYKAGWSTDTIERWVAGLVEEARKATMGIRFRVAWGRRREGPTLPAPALPHITSTDTKERNTTSYPFYEIYDSEEQALAAAAIRDQGKDIPPPLPASQSTE